MHPEDQNFPSVVVCRGWGDWRQVEVPVAELSDLHVTEFAGGTRARLPRPVLAAYMSCEVIPEQADFGHSCVHRAGPHRIKVLIHRRGNARAIYERLRRQAAEGASQGEGVARPASAREGPDAG